MFQVFDDGKPADTTGYPQLKGKGWENSCFNTLEKAREYARHWLGCYYEDSYFRIGIPYDYDGCGSMIEIREV